MSLPEEPVILKIIAGGGFTSRRQVARHFGVSHKNPTLLGILNRHGLLIPKHWSRESVQQALKALAAELGRIPRAQDNWNLASRAQERFWSWNDALFETFGRVNQERYSDMSADDLLGEVRRFMIQYQRIPLRQEFNGREWPEWTALAGRVGVTRWSEILGMVDTRGLRYYSQHGYGRIHRYGGRIYLSHGEYVIAKFLTRAGVVFDTEVPYGDESAHRFDFHLPAFDAYVEYYGIATEDYRARIETKRALYAGRTVIEIFKHDNTVRKLATEVQRLQSSLISASAGEKG